MKINKNRSRTELSLKKKTIEIFKESAAFHIVTSGFKYSQLEVARSSTLEGYV